MLAGATAHPKRDHSLRMIKTDSTIKETRRFDAIFKALARDIINPNGVYHV